MRNFVRNVLPKYQSRSPQLLAAIAERGMEEEIETDRTVFVSGDGVEDSAPDLGCDKRATLWGVADNNAAIDLAEDSDDAPSWIRSPVWPALPSRAPDVKEKGDIEHIEDARLENIPHLSLSHPSPLLQHAASVPPTPTRPYLTTDSTISSQPLVLSNPRRIQSMESLASMEPEFSQQAHAFQLFASSATRHSDVQTHLPTYPSSLTMSPAQQSLMSSPSMRKNRQSFGKTLPRRKSKGLLSVSDAGSRPSSGQGDLRRLVDDWTRQGPANQTVVVTSSSPVPSSQLCR